MSDNSSTPAAPDTVDRLDDLIGGSFADGADMTATLDGDIPNLEDKPEDKPEEKPEVTSDDKPEEKPEVTSDDKPEDKPEVKSDDPDDIDSKFPDLGDKATEKARNKWAEIRGDLKNARQELREREEKLAELQSKLQNVEGSEVQPELLTELQEKLAAKEKELSAFHIESTEVYQKEVKEPLAKLAGEAEKIGGEELVAALAEPDARKRSEALSNAVEDMNDFDRTTVYQMARQLDDVFARQGELRENADAALKEIEQQTALQRNQEQTQQREAFQSAAKDAWGVFERKLPFMQDESGELRPEYKEVLEEGMKTNLVEKPPMVQAYSAFSGLMLPKLLAEVRDLKQTNASLAETISELEGATPGGSDGSGGSSPDDSSAPAEDAEFGDELEARMAAGNILFTE